MPDGNTQRQRWNRLEALSLGDGVWAALAAAGGRDTATLKLLMMPAPRGVSISSPSLPPRGG